MKKAKIKINNKEFSCLQTETLAEQEKGLMFVYDNCPIMIFAYSKPNYNAFWMRNTFIPLDIVFCLNNKIIKICEGKPLSTDLIGGQILSDLIIEFPKGTCEASGIGEGAAVQFLNS